MRRPRPRLRHGVAALVVTILAVSGVAVVRARSAGDELRTQVVVVEARRGRILDRDGRVLVENGTIRRVAVEPAVYDALAPAARRGAVARLTEALAADRAERLVSDPASVRGAVPGAAPDSALPVPTVDVASVLARGTPDDDGLLTVAMSGSDSLVERLRDDPAAYPGVVVTVVAARRYPYGALAAHVLGYVAAPTGADDLPQGSPTVGRSGVERAYDSVLRGRPGRLVYEVDGGGRPVRELADRRTEPEPGRDVYLALDIDLQFQLEMSLAATVHQRRGQVDNGCFLQGGCDVPAAAGAVLDPRDGSVLALASYPTYDPALFAGGVATAEYTALTRDDADSPLVDRAIAGLYAPGSTIKPFTAHAALALGVTTADAPYDDTGTYLLDPECDIGAAGPDVACALQNAGGVAHGPVDLRRALAVSSDTYWFRLGDEAWKERDALGDEAVQREVEAWGFGRPTGIDLPGEQEGRVPTPEWLRDFAQSLDSPAEAGIWTSGDSANIAAGQGDLLVTPLQTAVAYGALARGGEGFVPHVVLRTTDAGSGEGADEVAPEPTVPVPVEQEWSDALLGGLGDAVTGPGGTARTTFAGFDLGACPVAGKTGTAQVTGRNDTSWFAAVAPSPASGREARLAVAVVVEGAGFGASAAAPVARRVLEPLGCDPGASPPAPLGGWFDVEAAAASFVPAPAGSSG